MVSIPGPRASIRQHMRFDIARQYHRDADRPGNRRLDLDQPRARFAITADHRQRLAIFVDGNIVLAEIIEITITTEYQKRQFGDS